MSIRKIIGMENGVEDFRLQVAPKSIVIPKGSKGFRLYLQKGMQIIGKFENDPNVSLKDSFYRFRNAHPVEFRVTNLNHSSYTWSLYLVNPETMEETFVDTASFNIERTIKLYQMQLLDKEREIQTSFREKAITKVMIIQLWNKAKKGMKTCRSNLKCVFSNQDYQIQFQVEAKNVLDYESEKLIMERQQRLLKRQRSDDFSSLSGSDLKGKSQNNSQVKEKYSEKTNFIQIQYTPFRSNKQKADEINTKQTIELEPDQYTNHVGKKENSQAEDKQKDVASIQNFNATVKIVDPTGEQIDQKRQQQGQRERKRSYSDSSNGSNPQHPMKKFSLLSDIIQMSYEGSSSYGHPDQSSSNGFNRMGLRKDGTMDYVIENDMPRQGHGLNKFKTLPYQSHNRHRLQVRNEFRRALTTEKNSNDFQTTSQLQEQSYISVNDNKNSKLAEKPKPSSGDPYGKWIILVAVLIIIAVISGSLFTQDNVKAPSKKKPIKNEKLK